MSKRLYLNPGAINHAANLTRNAADFSSSVRVPSPAGMDYSTILCARVVKALNKGFEITSADLAKAATNLNVSVQNVSGVDKDSAVEVESVYGGAVKTSEVNQ